MTRKLFGTDGVRGRANPYPMTAEMALRLGAAAGLAETESDPARAPQTDRRAAPRFRLESVFRF
jgi:phosphomannomutase